MFGLPHAQVSRFALATLVALVISLGGYSVVSAAGTPPASPAVPPAAGPAQGADKVLAGEETEAARLERLQAECAEWLAENPDATGKRAEFCANVVAGEVPPKPDRPTEAEVLARLQAKCSEWLAENPGATGAYAEFCASVMAGVIPERVKPEKPERPEVGERLEILKSICTDFLAAHPGETSERIDFCKRVIAAGTPASDKKPDKAARLEAQCERFIEKHEANDTINPRGERFQLCLRIVNADPAVAGLTIGQLELEQKAEKQAKQAGEVKAKKQQAEARQQAEAAKQKKARLGAQQQSHQ